MPNLKYQQIYRIHDREHQRTVIFRYIKPLWDDGEEWIIGTDVTTGSICRLYPQDWEFYELSPLEQELL
jgi:hypothetical protein